MFGMIPTLCYICLHTRIFLSRLSRCPGIAIYRCANLSALIDRRELDEFARMVVLSQKTFAEMKAEEGVFYTYMLEDFYCVSRSLLFL